MSLWSALYMAAEFADHVDFGTNADLPGKAFQVIISANSAAI